MKIANIILTSVNGGAEQVFIDYINIFNQLNHHNFAIVKQDAPYGNVAEKLCSKTLKITNNFGYYDLLAINKIKNFLLENDVDYVFAHAGRSIALAVKAIAKISNKKILLVAINHSNNVKRSIKADLVISVNKKIFYKTVDLGRTPHNSFVVHNALDLSNIQEIKSIIDLENKSEINLGVIGRFHKIKGFDQAIKTLKFIYDPQNKNLFSDKLLSKKINLIIAGIGEEENSLRKLVEEYRLENNVKFLGWVDQSEFFNKIDIFLQTSNIESFGLVTLEAMKYKKPIICTNTDGSKEIIRNEIDGLKVNIEESKELSEQFSLKIDRLVSDNNFTNILVNSSYKRLQEKFSYNNLKNILLEIVGKG
ncbi:MAG: glycosyltransferase family 4 protein [Alphaproteobacteria bacterium]